MRENPRLACKLHRPYLYRSLGTSGKLAALQAHYRLLQKVFPATVCSSLLRNERLSIATLQGKNASVLTLVLTQRHSFEKEGEISLQVCNTEGAPITTLTFTMTEPEGKVVLVIGGLQGPRKPFGIEEVQCATKNCHGLFPKRLIMEALVAIAHNIGAEQILAVGNREHVYSALRYRRTFLADYDSFWEEQGACKVEGKDLFCLSPRLPPRKAMDEIASKKRAEYQRRYKLLDDLARQVSETLTT